MIVRTKEFLYVLHIHKLHHELYLIDACICAVNNIANIYVINYAKFDTELKSN